MSESVESADAVEVEPFFAREWAAWDDEVGVAWNQTTHHLVVRRDGGIRAAAHFSIVGGVGHLNRLLVHKADARLGLGSLLLAGFERECRARGCHKLRLETAEYQARPFYERHGFRIVATLEDDRFHYALHVMERKIDHASVPL